ncbi:MAG: T9SS type A sorting domain-containing protein, partial [Tannerella sp.]|nr:T9SS type A sorting domain-containing protein [Tannerella sp.]
YGFGTVVCGQDGIDRTITLHNYGVVNGRLNTLFIAKDSFDPDSYVSGEDITPYLDDSGVFQAGKSPDWDVSVDAGPDAVVDGSDNTSWSVHVSSDADPGVYSRQLVAIYSSAGAPSTLYATAVPLTVTLVSPASLSVSPAILTDGHIAFPADREGYALSSVIDIILENEGQTAAVIRSASVQSDTCFSLINHNYTDYVPAISGSVKGSNNSYAVAPKTELQAGVYRDTVVFIFGDGTGTDRTLKVGVEFKIVPAWHTWAGGNKINPGDSDHAWSVPGNWIPAGLPDDIQFIRFDASAIDLHVDGNYTAPNITNTTPANLVIRKNAALTLTRVVNAKSTALDFTGGGKIHVASGDTTGVNGALTVPKGSSANVSFTFYTYATGPDNAETAGEMSWQYFGIPVKEYQAISMEGGFIREYDETRTTGYWKFLENSDVLKAATGYEISRKRYQGGFFTFAGALNTNDMTLTGLTLTSGAAYPGQHLASNPYAAGLSIKNGLEFGDNMEDAVYLFHTGSRSDWENNQAEVSGHAAGQYLAVPRVQAGSGGLPDTLASMQGFVVRVDAGKTPDPAKNSLTFKYESLTKGNAQLRSASAATPKVSTVVTLSETGGGVKDRIWLFSDRNATFGYDNGYDGYKIFGESTLAGLYVKHGERNYQVSTQPTVDSTWLFLKAASNVTDYTLTFRHDNLEARYGSLYLYDAVTNTTVEITDDSAAYRFTAGNVLTGDRRFLLTAAGAATSIDGADVPAPCLSMYGNNGITVENGCSLPVHVQVYSLQGRLLHVADVAGQSRETLSGRFIPGMYIVRAIAGTEIRTEKIVITDKY